MDEKISDVGNNNFCKTLTFKLHPFCKGTKFDIFAHLDNKFNKLSGKNTKQFTREFDQNYYFSRANDFLIHPVTYLIHYIICRANGIHHPTGDTRGQHFQ